MHASPFRLCIGALAFTAGLTRGIVALLVPMKSQSSTIDDPAGLRKKIVGHSKKEVARLLGPPPAAASLAPYPTSPTYLMANVWYYPFDARNQSAVAVQFNHGRVVGVDFIES